MKVKEAIIKVLEEKKTALTYLEVNDAIIERDYIDWSNAKTPADTVAAQLGDFIRKNDTRVKRVKGRRGYEYYLPKYEDELNLSEAVESQRRMKKDKVSRTYQERALHKLLATYLKSNNTYAKTIFHEKSSNTKDNHQKWIHPDMIGIHFQNLKNKFSQSLMKLTNKTDAFNLISYELKREIKTDYELKKCYFQAVSNSSWANFGYLVVFDISQNLYDEMERLTESFGIGVIELKSNPYESEVLFQSKYKELDFKTIDKLCEINKAFEKFILKTETMLIATDRYIEASEKEFEEFCDEYFISDTQIEEYCKTYNIPFEESRDFD